MNTERCRMGRWLAFMLKIPHEYMGILHAHATQNFLNLAVEE